MTFVPEAQQDIEEKRAELFRLAQVVDLWIGTPLTVDKKNKVKSILEELQAKLDDLDHQFLETKLQYYRRLHDLLKD